MWSTRTTNTWSYPFRWPCSSWACGWLWKSKRCLDSEFRLQNNLKTPIFRIPFVSLMTDDVHGIGGRRAGVCLCEGLRCRALFCSGSQLCVWVESSVECDNSSVSCECQYLRAMNHIVLVAWLLLTLYCTTASRPAVGIHFDLWGASRRCTKTQTLSFLARGRLWWTVRRRVRMREGVSDRLTNQSPVPSVFNRRVLRCEQR